MFLNKKFESNTYILFEKTFIVFCLYNLICLSFNFNEFFSTNSSIVEIGTLNKFKFYYLFDLLSYFNSNLLSLLVLLTHALFLLLCFFDKYKPASLLFILLTHYIIYTKAHYVIDGGDRLASQFIIYLLLINLTQNAYTKNLLIYCMKFQVIFIYIVSALYKLDGENWINGQGLSYTLLVDEYTHPILVALVHPLKYLFISSSYFLLFIKNCRIFN